jgi:hypothetical protein
LFVPRSDRRGRSTYRGKLWKGGSSRTPPEDPTTAKGQRAKVKVKGSQRKAKVKIRVKVELNWTTRVRGQRVKVSFSHGLGLAEEKKVFYFVRRLS